MNLHRTHTGPTENDLPPTMRAVAHERYGAPADVLRPVERPVPSPGDGEVRVRVAAASLNPLDWHFTCGTPYLLRLVGGLRGPKNQVRGADVAGTVVAVGDGVDGLAVGDRVAGLARGSFAEYAIDRPGTLAVIPDGVTWTDAAALPIAGITALQALRDHARVERGQRILVNGAAGGVGTCTVQLAVAMGAEVTAVCSTRNVEMVQRLGASRVIDYTVDDWVDGTEYDAIIDNVGNRSLGDCVRSLVAGGRYVMVSGPKKNRWLDPFRRIVVARFRFLRSGRSFHDVTAKGSSADMEELLGHVAAGRLIPVIERRIGLDDVPEALADIGAGHVRAKIVVDIGE